MKRLGTYEQKNADGDVGVVMVWEFEEPGFSRHIMAQVVWPDGTTQRVDIPAGVVDVIRKTALQ